jgi:hypothetical protein
MALDTKTDDWQVCMILNAAAGAGIAAGDFRFDFYSAKANLTARFKFYGVGVGAGGNLSGMVLPATIGPFGPWSGITCDQQFSVWDLNGCWGRLSAIGGGAGVVFGPMMITAAKRFWSTTTLFHSQNVGGFGGGGAGVGGEVLIGGWHYATLSHNQPGSDGADDLMA